MWKEYAVTYVRFMMAALVLGLGGLTLLGSRPAVGQAPANPAVINGFPQGRAVYQTAPDWEGIGGKPGDAELHKLMQLEGKGEREVASLLEEYGRTESETQRGKIKGKLAEVLEKQFDLQQKRRDLEVARIEAQLKKLRDLMKKRSEARQTIVEKRLDQLLSEAAGLGWTSPPGVQPGNLFYRASGLQVR
jgi:hypothetical protein